MLLPNTSSKMQLVTSSATATSTPPRAPSPSRRPVSVPSKPEPQPALVLPAQPRFDASGTVTFALGLAGRGTAYPLDGQPAIDPTTYDDDIAMIAALYFFHQ